MMIFVQELMGYYYAKNLIACKNWPGSTGGADPGWDWPDPYATFGKNWCQIRIRPKVTGSRNCKKNLIFSNCTIIFKNKMWYFYLYIISYLILTLVIFIEKKIMATNFSGILSAEQNVMPKSGTIFLLQSDPQFFFQRPG